jgi:hypothetical protein
MTDSWLRSPECHFVFGEPVLRHGRAATHQPKPSNAAAGTERSIKKDPRVSLPRLTRAGFLTSEAHLRLVEEARPGSFARPRRRAFIILGGALEDRDHVMAIARLPHISTNASSICTIRVCPTRCDHAGTLIDLQITEASFAGRAIAVARALGLWSRAALLQRPGRSPSRRGR